MSSVVVSGRRTATLHDRQGTTTSESQRPNASAMTAGSGGPDRSRPPTSSTSAGNRRAADHEYSGGLWAGVGKGVRDPARYEDQGPGPPHLALGAEEELDGSLDDEPGLVVPVVHVERRPRHARLHGALQHREVTRPRLDLHPGLPQVRPKGSALARAGQDHVGGHGVFFLEHEPAARDHRTPRSRIPAARTAPPPPQRRRLTIVSRAWSQRQGGSVPCSRTPPIHRSTPLSASPAAVTPVAEGAGLRRASPRPAAGWPRCGSCWSGCRSAERGSRPRPARPPRRAPGPSP